MKPYTSKSKPHPQPKPLVTVPSAPTPTPDSDPIVKPQTSKPATPPPVAKPAPSQKPPVSVNGNSTVKAFSSTVSVASSTVGNSTEAACPDPGLPPKQSLAPSPQQTLGTLQDLTSDKQPNFVAQRVKCATPPNRASLGLLVQPEGAGHKASPRVKIALSVSAVSAVQGTINGSGQQLAVASHAPVASSAAQTSALDLSDQPLSTRARRASPKPASSEVTMGVLQGADQTIAVATKPKKLTEALVGKTEESQSKKLGSESKGQGEINHSKHLGAGSKGAEAGSSQGLSPMEASSVKEPHKEQDLLNKPLRARARQRAPAL